MISIKSYVYVSDSSGARIAECIKILKSKYYRSKIARELIIAVKIARPERKAKRHDVLKGMIIRLKKKTYRNNGIKLMFGDNSVIVYKKSGELMGSRLFGPVTHELRNGKNLKILSISTSVI